MFCSSLRFQSAVLAPLLLTAAAPAFAGAELHLPKESVAALSQFCRNLENDPTRPRVESTEASCIALGLKYLSKNNGSKPLAFEDEAGLFIGVCSKLEAVIAYPELSGSDQSSQVAQLNEEASLAGQTIDHTELMTRRSACYKSAYDELAKVQPAMMARFAQPHAVEWQKSEISNEQPSARTPAGASTDISKDTQICVDFSGATILGLKATGVLGRHYRACEMADQADVLYDWKGAAVFYVRYHSEWQASKTCRRGHAVR